MDTDIIPTFGYTQPRKEDQFEISSIHMAEKGKRGVRPPSAQARKLRLILKSNLELLMDRDYPAKKFKNKSDRQMEIARDFGMSWSSIQRSIDPKRGITLDLLADLAVGFTLKAHELLDPDLVNSRHFVVQERPAPPPAQKVGA